MEQPAIASPTTPINMRFQFISFSLLLAALESKVRPLSIFPVRLHGRKLGKTHTDLEEIAYHPSKSIQTGR